MMIYKIMIVMLACTAATILKAQEAKGIPSTDPGKVVYEQNCLTCHQVDGSGVPHLAPPLIKTSFVLGDKKRLINIVLHGLKDVEVEGESYGNPMPSFDFLSDKQIADVLTYVRNNFTNEARAVTTTEVAKIRKDK